MATIDHLPDSLLGAILTRLGRHRAASALLVSKRWHRVFLSEPELWRRFSFSGSQAASKLALLRRVGSLVCSLDMTGASADEQAEALACAQPSHLTELAVTAPTSQTVQLLPRFTSLSRLGLGSDPPANYLEALHWAEPPLPPGLGAVLLRLPQLRTLALGSSSEAAADLMAALLACTQLADLSLSAGGFEQPEALPQLTRLRGLSSLQLKLRTADEAACFVPPEPRLFPALTSFAFQRSHAKGRLHNELYLQVADCMLHACSCGAPDPQYDDPHEHNTESLLTLEYVKSEVNMQRLLATVHPGSVPAVQRLRLSRCAINASALAGCSELAAVTQLRLDDCQAAGSWDAAFAALFEQAPLLRSLRTSSCFHGELPASLVAHTGLRQLTLWDNEMDVLPAGPYLASLERLYIEEDGMLQLFPALTAATALTCLGLMRHGWGNAPPLSTVGISAALAGMPRLRTLQLVECRLAALPIDDWAGMSALESLDLRQNSFTLLPAALSRALSLRQLDLSSNNFTSLPAELHQATALRQLNLSQNYSLCPTAQQLGVLLSHLPLLEELNLSATGLTELPEQLPAGLRTINVQHNQLQSLPPGLACESLTSLGLWCNPLRLNRADMERLLTNMPRLHDLAGWGDYTTRDAKSYVSGTLSLRGCPGD